jgi:hypothetical protein
MPETRQSKKARIENSPSQRRRERNEREDFSQAAARIVQEATKELIGANCCEQAVTQPSSPALWLRQPPALFPLS